MIRHKLSVYGAAVAALLAASGAARADDFDLMSSDGPMRLHISRDGDVDGEYPKSDGILRGHVSRDGDVRGIWMQPHSDRPCREFRGDTQTWGRFEITGLFSRRPVGFWSYCDEPPDRDWRLRRER